MKLDYKKTFFIGLAFLSISAFWQLYDSIIPLMLKQTFAMNDAVSGFIMSLDNILALVMLPLVGAWSDKINTRIGKRTPFILFGTLSAVTLMIVLPLAINAKSLLMFVIALGLVLVAMGSYRSPAVALMPDLTPKPLRSKANAIINLMGALGAIFTLVMISIMVKGPTPDYLPLFISVAALMLLALGVLLLSVNERKMAIEPDNTIEEITKTSNGKLHPAVQQSLNFLLLSVALWFMGYNAVTTAFSKYCVYYWGMSDGNFAQPLLVATGAAVLAFIPVGILSSKLGRKKMIVFGLLLLSTCYVIALSFRSFSPYLNIVFALVGLAWASINVNSYPMVVEMSQSNDIGKYTGLYYTFSMAAQIITPILSGVLLQYVGYFTLFPYAAICVILSMITFQFVKHGDNKPVLPQSKFDLLGQDE
jgi:maltose/moltooligosaccharide transporter